MDLAIAAQTESVFAQFLKAKLEALNIDATIYLGILDKTKKINYPAIDIVCRTGDEVAREFAVWNMQLDIKVKEMVRDSSNGVSIAHQVFSCLDYDGVENDLNAISPNYFVEEVYPKKPTNENQGDAWIQTMSYDIICELQ